MNAAYGLTEQELSQGYLNRCTRRHQDVKAYFLRFNDPAEWDKVNSNPALFNRYWRKMLKLAPGDMPPPVEFRR